MEGEVVRNDDGQEEDLAIGNECCTQQGIFKIHIDIAKSANDLMRPNFQVQ